MASRSFDLGLFLKRSNPLDYSSGFPQVVPPGAAPPVATGGAPNPPSSAATRDRAARAGRGGADRLLPSDGISAVDIAAMSRRGAPSVEASSAPPRPARGGRGAGIGNLLRWVVGGATAGGAAQGVYNWAHNAHNREQQIQRNTENQAQTNLDAVRERTAVPAARQGQGGPAAPAARPDARPDARPGQDAVDALASRPDLQSLGERRDAQQLQAPAWYQSPWVWAGVPALGLGGALLYNQLRIPNPESRIPNPESRTPNDEETA